MIEIEIKCKPTSEEEAILLKDATFLSEEHLTDIYYDSSTYELSVKDFWLRTRNDKFVLKTPASSIALLKTQANTPKHEIEDKQTIKKILNLANQHSLKEALKIAGYNPLYKLTKTRKKYSKEGFIIDIDNATFENYKFNLCEIETMVEAQEEIEKATQDLVNFAKRNGIEIKPIPGNLIALIKIVNPKHFAILEKAHTERIKNQTDNAKFNL